MFLIFSETGFLGACPVDTPMDSTLKLDKEQGDLFSDVNQYHCLVAKLLYLEVTHLDITYAIGVVSQFM